MPIPDPTGPEVLVNTTTAGVQDHPDVTALADGGWVVTWTGEPVFGNTEVYTQAYNGDGTKRGGEVVVNTVTTGNQNVASITALSDGGWVVSWTDGQQANGDTSGAAVRAQVYAADGTPQGGEFLINTTTAGTQTDPNVTLLTDGGFVVAWTSYDPVAGQTLGRTHYQVFDADGSPLGAERVVTATSAFNDPNAAIAALADGGFAITWSRGSDVPGGYDYDTWTQAFNADGTPRGVGVQVNTVDGNASQSGSDIVGLADGGYVVTYRDPLGENQGTPNSIDVRGQVYNADGSKRGGEFLIDATSLGSQVDPTVAALADGRFVVTWSDFDGTLGDTTGAIHSQVFDPRTSGITLVGTAGDDSYVGSAFVDDVQGGVGNDHLIGGGANDKLYGGTGNDVLDDSAGLDSLFGGNGDDSLAGGAAADPLDGGSRRDPRDGGASADLLIGGEGGDTYILADLLDTVTETSAASGTDAVQSSAVSLNLVSYANIESARLVGSAALNVTGNNAANTLTGNDGANTITGNGGADRIKGNGGDDVFVFVPGSGADRVTDFADGQDRLDLRAYDFANAADALSGAVQQGTAVILTLATGDVVTLNRVDLADLGSADLIL